MYKKIASIRVPASSTPIVWSAESVCAEGEPRNDSSAAYRDHLDRGRAAGQPGAVGHQAQFAVDWTPYLNKKYTASADTSGAAAG